MGKTRGAAPGVTVANQDIYEESSTQKHRIGARLQIGDRVFYYCKAGEAITYPSKGAINYSKPYQGDRAATAYALGATEITIPTTASSNSVSNTAADAYADGYIWFQTAVHQLYRIRKNTVSDGTNQILTLYDGLTTVLPTGTAGTTRWITVWRNQYADVRNATTGGALSSVVCVPLIQVTSGYYFWGQTWGPVFLTVHDTVPGKASNSRLVYFSDDGCAMEAPTDRSTDYGRQIAGYLLARTTADDGDQFIMLQLAP